MIRIGVITCVGILLLFHSGRAQFSDIAEHTGLDKSTVSLSLMGGGAAFVDYDNDGLLDIYLVGGDDPDYLFRNTGQGTYEDISSEAYITQFTDGYNTTAVAVGDINNDGCKDLFITSFSRSKSSLLLLNDCAGGFTNITKQSGIGSMVSSGTGVAFLDVNLDGHLDIYVVNYIDKRHFVYDESSQISGFDHTGFPNHLFVNNGDQTFTEMGESYGVADAGCGLAVLPTDYDQDGDQDLIVVNDFGQWVQPNALLKNNYPDMLFSDVSAESGMDEGIYGMGVASGDFDNDGDLDYYMTNLGANILMQNNGDLTFKNVAKPFDVDNNNNLDGTNTTGWGCFFFDYDNDTNLDLYVSNGYIPASPFLNTSATDASVLFHNNGHSFLNVSEEYGLDNKEINRGAIYGDYDNNGTQEIFVIATSKGGKGASSLYENNLNSNHWIDIKLEGTITNKDAYGAWAYLYIGEKTYIKELSSGGSHASQHSSLLHFGLGSVEHIDSLEIIWPLGEQQIIKNIDVDQQILVVEGKSEYDIIGCLDSRYDNYQPNATISSGCFTSTKVVGCMNVNAENYNSLAEIDDGSCIVITSALESDPVQPVIYPMPFSSDLQIRLPDATNNYRIELIELQGKLLRQDNLKPGNLSVLNMQNLPSGLYLIKIINTQSGKVYSEKVMKK
ncbi:FG-GAP-like repeat-containing protein [Reichenbachiella sp.]|uniref:FG-GAP-like repeat-containing protein n=1 Tax=Reichenbachiella sp. TaxID=2184521 RepID=UPI00329A6F7F